MTFKGGIPPIGSGTYTNILIKNAFDASSRLGRTKVGRAPHGWYP